MDDASPIVTLQAPLDWQGVFAIAEGRKELVLSPDAQQRISVAAALRARIAQDDIRAYGINTGVGALSDTRIEATQQSAFSHNILRSHAVGLGAPLDHAAVRAIMAAAVNNYAHGYSGIRLDVVQGLVTCLARDCTPVVPREGSVGYLTHMAHIALVLTGEGRADLASEQGLPGAVALDRLGLEPLRLQAKEGLSLVNGTPCATGMGALLVGRLARLLDWADLVAAMSFEVLGAQLSLLDTHSVTLREGCGMAEAARCVRWLLEGSAFLARSQGARTQDALSVRAIPHVHGAVRDVWRSTAACVDAELRSVTDNPAIAGTVERPIVYSQAHAVSPAMGLAFDQVAIAMAELGMMSERRLDRMLNPAVSGLPPFLAGSSGVQSGFMIAQYTATSLVARNRRMSAPASLDGGITSALQEDMLCHATPSVLKAADIVETLRYLLAIECLAACQAYDLIDAAEELAPRTRVALQRVRAHIPRYEDDRPLSGDIEQMARFMAAHTVSDILGEAPGPNA